MDPITSKGIEVSGSGGETPEEMRSGLAAIDTPEETPPAPEPKGDAAGQEPAEEASADEPAPVEKPGDKRGKPRSDAAARMQQATAREAAAKREAAETRRELEELRAENSRLRTPEGRTKPEAAPALTPAQQRAAEYKAIAALPGAPQQADFETWEEFNGAMQVFVADARAEMHEGRQRQQQQQHHVVQSIFRDRDRLAEELKTAQAEEPGFLETVNPDLLHTERLSVVELKGGRPTFGNFLVEEVFKAEHPLAMMRYLTTETVQRLAALHSTDAVLRDLARFDGQQGASAATQTGPARPAVSRAQTPIKPVKSSAQVHSDEPPGDDASDAEHEAYWGPRRARLRA